MSGSPQVRKSVKLKHNGIWECGVYGLNGWGVYGSNVCASYGKVIYCFWEIYSKSTGLQGSTLSGHRMTTGFGRPH